MKFGLQNLRRLGVHKTAAQAQDERGDVLVMFAAALVVMIFFVGLAMDASVVLMAHSRLNGVCQLVAQDRLTYQDTVRYSEQPGSDFSKCIIQTLGANGFTDKGELYFTEDTRSENKRHYKARIVLHGSCDTHFLKLFGLKKIDFAAQTDFDDTYGEPNDNVVWSPSVPASSYSGHYTFTDGAVTGFNAGKLPDGWTIA
ncbi:TadE/TadG family type IV pilus assembly protein [Atopobium fossor]|uniref:TadE/TadG family type IV pilus assembly protein n=1 Tax=Atopobium fossor TaxID=39487 RepID=UPI0003F8E081|nr:Tad domain-containing protein [Atopobium fossor]